MGTTLMGKFDFSSWTLHMASIMIFGTVWGLILREWRDSSLRTHTLNLLGLTILVSSTVIVGYGNYLGSLSTTEERNPHADARIPGPRPGGARRDREWVRSCAVPGLWTATDRRS